MGEFCYRYLRILLGKVGILNLYASHMQSIIVMKKQ